MKKIIKISLLAIMGLTLLTGCGFNNNINLGDYTKNKINPIETTTTTTKPATKYITANLNEQIKTDFVEITLDSSSSNKEIKPEKPKSFYTYRKEQEGKTYFYVKGNIKNISGEQFEYADNMYVKFKFDNNYSYDGSVAADEDGSLSYIYAYLEPLEAETFYMYASIPNELIDSFQNVDVYFGFKKNFEHKYGITEDECDFVYNLKLSK